MVGCTETKAPGRLGLAKTRASKVLTGKPDAGIKSRPTTQGASVQTI